MEGEMRLPLHPHRAQSRLKPGEPLRIDSHAEPGLPGMNFKAIQVVCMAVSTLVDEMTWDTYGSQALHTPVIVDDKDCHRLDLLVDIMGTLTRMLDTRIAFVSSEGKVIREWIETIVEIGSRYRIELEALEAAEHVRAGLTEAAGSSD